MSKKPQRRRKNLFEEELNNQSNFIKEKVQKTFLKNRRQNSPQNYIKSEQLNNDIFQTAILKKNEIYFMGKEEQQGQKKQANNQTQDYLHNQSSIIKKRKKPTKKKKDFFQEQNQQLIFQQQSFNSKTESVLPVVDIQINNSQLESLQSQFYELENSQIRKEKNKDANESESSISHQDQDIFKMIQNSKNKKQELKKQKQHQLQHISFRNIFQQIGLSKEDRKNFFYSIPSLEDRYICYFKRYQSGLSQSYQLISQDNILMLHCQNQRGSIGCNMYISLTKQMDKKSSSYLGKLRGNAVGSCYQLYDSGLQPNNKNDHANWRINMATIQYDNNFMGINGPRKLKATLPNIKKYQSWDIFKLNQGQNLNTLSLSMTAQIYTIIRQYRNKEPKWIENMNSYALNFGGRVKKPSIKNFILVPEIQSKSEIESKGPFPLVFGKIDQNTYSLECGYPLSLFQAFGIAVSQFDFKIHCQ